MRCMGRVYAWQGLGVGPLRELWLPAGHRVACATEKEAAAKAAAVAAREAERQAVAAGRVAGVP
eukprot:scaffold2182_cov118-Isochrysis_galbana.AAC.3